MKIKWCISMGGLNKNIQNIIDYKEYDSIQHLFLLAMLVEKEL
jgi:hypothetical protein